MKQKNKLKVGDFVKWNDPEGISSGIYKIESLDNNSEDENDILTISNEYSTAEVFRHEIEWVA